MTGENKNIDELFSKELKNFSAKPPKDIWIGIEQELAGKRKKSPIFWISRIAAAVLLLFGATGIMFYLHRNTPGAITASIGTEKQAHKPATDSNSFTEAPDTKIIIDSNSQSNYTLETSNKGLTSSEDKIIKQNNSQSLGTTNSSLKEKSFESDTKSFAIVNPESLSSAQKQETEEISQSEGNSNPKEYLQKTNTPTESLQKDKTAVFASLETANSTSETEDIGTNNKSTNTEAPANFHAPIVNPIEKETETAMLQSRISLLELDKELEEDVVVKPETNAKVNEAYLALLAEFKDPDEKKDNYDKWLVGGQAGPQYSYRQLISEYVSQEYIDSYNESENGIVAYAGGINVAYKPVKRLSIQSGIYYSKMGQTASAQYTDAVSLDNGDALVLYGNTETNTLDSEENVPKVSVSTSMGTVESKLTSSTTVSEEEASDINNKYSGVDQVSQYLEFLEIPLIARYAIIDRKFDFHLLGGVSTNFLVASPVYLEDGSYFKETSNLNTINYSSTMGLGFGYSFSDDLVFSLEPQFKYYLNQVNKSSSTEYHPYSFGIYTGVTYAF